MKQEELSQIAKDIINSNIHMTLATCGKKPWASPVYYCIDNKFNFYFTSQPSSLHIRNLDKNNNVAFAIFHSQPEGRVNGVQGLGKVTMLKNEDIKEALKWYKTDFIDLKFENLKAPAPYRLYKITTEKLFVQDPESNDKRIEVFIKTTKLR